MEETTLSNVKTGKKYNCKKLIENKICGETNPDNFIKGRYTVCKRCTKLNLKEYKEKQKLEKKRNIVDPIDDYIHNKPIIEKKTIIGVITEINRKMSTLEQMQIRIKKLLNEIEEQKKKTKVISDSIKELEKVKEEIKIFKDSLPEI